MDPKVRRAIPIDMTLITACVSLKYEHGHDVNLTADSFPYSEDLTDGWQPQANLKNRWCVNIRVVNLSALKWLNHWIR